MTEEPQMTIRPILQRLLADVDDSMEFAGTMFKTKDSASQQVLEKLAQAEADILALVPEKKVGTEKIPLNSTEHGYNIAIDDVLRAFKGTTFTDDFNLPGWAPDDEMKS